ncbi:hypothetical protein ABH991_001677 [Bradyrhizobium ottawaense]|uniref:Uncharacterized protein n=1 Tax=Bradyrhizobium ottawaense TaxID=931866 RepID=A0ABV4FNQ1_9BRAD
MFSEISLPVPSQQTTRFFGGGVAVVLHGLRLRLMLPGRV